MDDLHELLADAVDDVEPGDRLAEIRARTRRPARPPWRYAVGGVVLATAATVATVAVVTSDPPPTPQTPPVARPPAASTSTDPVATPTPTSHLVAVYYVGDTPRGPRLFREFRTELGVPTDGLETYDVLTATPHDPDYRTYWPAEAFAASIGDPEAGVVNVFLDGDSLADRPAGMSEDEAALALQQLVYTLRATYPDEAAPIDLVQLNFSTGEGDSRPAPTVLGLPGRVPVTPALDVLGHVSISDPVEGRVVTGSFTARGVASSPEATVPWELRRGDEVVRDGFATAEGWLDRLYPWETTVDVSGLEPGEYTFVAMTADESGGEGPGPDVDTRTVVVE